jgi:deferrochelatase/peroxidase EfeB
VSDSIQSGVHFRPGETAPPAYRLLLLNVVAGATPEAIESSIASIWTMLHDLRSGRVRELVGEPENRRRQVTDQFSDLGILVAYGRRLFDASAHDPPLTYLDRPPYLAYLDKRSAFPSLPWDARGRPGETDVALQFTAGSVAAVTCATVEVWKMIQDHGLPLQPVESFDGFARLDGRGWLEFHDGVNNMDSALRAKAIEANAPEWMAGGTYMTFLRIRVDLAAWRAVGRGRQELSVGRSKLSGAALEAVHETEDGNLVAHARPFDFDDSEAIMEWRDPPQRADPHLERSHIHRANQSRGSPEAPGSFRMFRQGYEFLDEMGGDVPRLGLNFVSFQRDLRVFQHVMHAPGWLGDSGFGGDAPADLLSLEAGGFFAVPPTGEAFPGRELFRAH